MSYNDMLLIKQSKTLIFLIRSKQRLKYHKRKSLGKYESDKQCYNKFNPQTCSIDDFRCTTGNWPAILKNSRNI